MFLIKIYGNYLNSAFALFFCYNPFRPKELINIIKKIEFTHYNNVDESIKVLRKEKNQ